MIAGSSSGGACAQSVEDVEVFSIDQETSFAHEQCTSEWHFQRVLNQHTLSTGEFFTKYHVVLGLLKIKKTN